MSPKVSIITATRNAMAHLPALADAILRHPPGLLEWIVIDCVSCDGTVEYLRGLGDPRLRWVSEPDSGIYDAWNKGVEQAGGRWILFLGAEDRPGPGWIEACGAVPELDLVYGDLDVSANQVVHPRSGKLKLRTGNFPGVSGEPPQSSQVLPFQSSPFR